jgi:L-alanine-DL-glutamate epimerase-like enolase superfamily enzyme
VKITSVALTELTALVEDSGRFRPEREDRLGMPVDIYPEHKAKGPPPPAPIYERDPRSGLYRISTGLLEVYTDDGVTGLALGAAESPALRRAAELMVGADPMATERIWDVAYRSLLSLTPGGTMFALAAMDLALWDLKSKALGVPVCSLLGGPVRRSVPAYAMMRDYSKDPEQASRHAAEIVGRGFGAMKWYPRWGPTDGRAGMAKTIALVEALRETIGPDVEIMLDCWKTWDVPYTLEMAERLRDYRVFWIEEPVFQFKYAQYGEIRRKVRGVRISGGEQLYTLGEFKLLFDHQGVDIAQPDPFWCGGITPTMKIVHLAQAYEVAVVMHVVKEVVNVHISGALSPAVCPLIEYPTYQSQYTDQLFQGNKVLAVNGEVPVPTTPGLFVVDEGVIRERREIFRVGL